MKENMEGVIELHPGIEPIMPAIPDLIDTDGKGDPFSFDVPLSVSTTTVSRDRW